MLAFVIYPLFSFALDDNNFFINQPDGTTLIDMDGVNKRKNWKDESPSSDNGAGYGQWTDTLNEWIEVSFVGSKLYIYGTKDSFFGSFIIYNDGNFNKIAIFWFVSELVFIIY